MAGDDDTNLHAPLPAIPGVTFRRLHGTDDYPLLVAVHEGSRDADGIDPRSTLEWIPTAAEFGEEFAPSARFDPSRDVLIVEAYGHVIGYSYVTWWIERDGLRLYLLLAALLPAFRGSGIGSALLEWAERRARQRHAQSTATGSAMFGANASSTEADATRLLLDHGYRATFELLEMEYASAASTADLPLPPGITLRPAAPEHYRAIWDSVQAAYAESPQNIVPDEEQYRRWLAQPSFDPSLWQVAWEGEAIVGQVLPEIARGRGEIAEVSVGQRWRGKGLARALLLRGIYAVQERGATPIRLHCRADNRFGAPALYESAGFRTLKRFARYRKPMA
ncbi:MAG TPA: GNAT family N-acetyltransferase [Ktedonobacterales bacterium]|nr:GNAT family N-acetyltransferase [Ktedonobacterales bacterium]